MYEIEFRGEFTKCASLGDICFSAMVDGLYIIREETSGCLIFIIVKHQYVVSSYTEKEFFETIKASCDRMMWFILNEPGNDQMYQKIIQYDLAWIKTYVTEEDRQMSDHGAMIKHVSVENVNTWVCAIPLRHAVEMLIKDPHRTDLLLLVQRLREEWHQTSLQLEKVE